MTPTLPPTPDPTPAPHPTPGIRRTLWLALAAVWALVVAVNWPGHLSYDSVIQLLDGRSGRYHTWHPPFMAWLLGLCDAVARGQGLYVALQVLLFVTALGLLAQARERLAPWAPLVVLLLAASPLILLFQAIVWKDVLFADLVVAGFAALRLAVRCDSGRWPRRAWTTAAFAALTAASLVRQNGALMLLAGAAALSWCAWREAGGERRLRALVRPAAHGLAGFVLGLVVVGLAGAALATRSVDGNGPAQQLEMLQTYDVVGAVAHDPSIRLDRLPPPLATLIRHAARTVYTPARNDELLNNSFASTASAAAPAIQAQWVEIILHHPLPWLRHRVENLGYVIASPLNTCPRDATGVDGPPAALAALHMAESQTPRDWAIEAYAAKFHRTPVYAHLTYALLAVGLCVTLFRSRRSEDAVLGFMLIGAFAFTLSFLAIGVACDYRYLYALDLSTMAAAVFVAIGSPRTIGPSEPTVAGRS